MELFVYDDADRFEIKRIWSLVLIIILMKLIAKQHSNLLARKISLEEALDQAL